MFIQHLATEAQNMAKAERKPRRNIQYKDLGGFTHKLSAKHEERTRLD